MSFPSTDNQSFGRIFSAIWLADNSYKISKLDICINGQSNFLREYSSISEIYLYCNTWYSKH